MSTATAAGQGRRETRESSTAGQNRGGLVGGLLRAAIGAITVGAVHFGAHLLFGDPAVFAQAGVTPAGIAASLAGAAVALLL